MVISAQQLAQQLRDLGSEKRIVCIHPNFTTAHLILSAVWEDAAYIRFQGTALNEAHSQAQVEAALQRHAVNPGHDGGLKYLILDEADRIAPDALIRLLKTLIDRAEPNRLIVLSRVLVEGLLDDAVLRQQTAFLPTDPQLMLWDYAQNQGEILLEVRAFGEGRVHLNGRRIEAWDGALPRALFFYLVDRGMVTRAEIFKTFWPNLSTREATNVFHVTKRKISEVLKTELTVYGSGFYHISPRIQLSYDVSLFNQFLQETDNDAARGAALSAALALYRGNYLVSLKSAWVESRRDALQQAACDALVALGKIYEAQGEQQQALGAYLCASRLRPEREDSAHAAMRIYGALGMADDGLRVYRLLAKTLRERLKVTPSPQVQQLAAQLGL